MKFPNLTDDFVREKLFERHHRLIGGARGQTARTPLVEDFAKTTQNAELHDIAEMRDAKSKKCNDTLVIKSNQGTNLLAIRSKTVQRLCVKQKHTQ